MQKFSNPQLMGSLGISQTTHGASKTHPDDLSHQRAIDLLIAGNKPIYSEYNGRIDIVTTSGAGYVSGIPDGAWFRVMNVHLYKFAVKVGQYVKKGQLLGYVNPLYNHLHFALENLTGLAPHPEPLDFFDRSQIFTTPYPSIAQMWFKNGKLDWNLFHDYYYDTPITSSSYEMVTLQQKLNIITTNTSSMNLRPEPSTSKPPIGKVDPNTTFTTNMIANGESVSGISTWYKYGNGWLTGAFCKEQPLTCPDYSKELAQLKVYQQKETQTKEIWCK